jgi:hypothetical protein
MSEIDSFFAGTWIDQRGNLASISEVANLGVATGQLTVAFSTAVNRPGQFPGTKTVANGKPAVIEVNFTDVNQTIKGSMQLDGQVILWENKSLWLRQMMDPTLS